MLFDFVAPEKEQNISDHSVSAGYGDTEAFFSSRVFSPSCFLKILRFRNLQTTFTRLAYSITVAKI